VPIVPLYGHEALRARLAAQHDRGALPASLLFHGPAGIGKQRLALWLAQRIVCDGTGKPCGECQHCRFALSLHHRDIFWLYPHGSVPGGNDADVDELRQEWDAAVQERAEAHGLYARPDGSCGIFKYDTRMLVFFASRSPALAKRKVIVVGDAERMVSQAASAEAANAFLKLLEEPPADTSILLTSSEPGALLPTIRSRTVSVRVAPLSDDAVRAFLADPLVASAVPNLPSAELVRLATGAPGSLLGAAGRATAVARAKVLLAAAEAGAEHRYRAAFTSGASKARGAFSDVLDALTVLVHDRARDAAVRGDDAGARRAARAIPAIEEAKRAAESNANPQIVTAQLLATMGSAPR